MPLFKRRSREPPTMLGYLSDSRDGKPWILPADLVKVEQVKPLSLTDLAIKDTVELDKRTVASILGVPPYFVGIGDYSAAAHNGFIRTEGVHIASVIEQQLTQKLLENERRYFKVSRRRLYDYDLKTLEFRISEIETDGYKVGGFIVIDNYILKDSDIALGEEIMYMLGQSIGYALDKAIVFGLGPNSKMPVGIMTRLAQTAQPAYWGDNQGDWPPFYEAGRQSAGLYGVNINRRQQWPR